MEKKKKFLKLQFVFSHFKVMTFLNETMENTFPVTLKSSLDITGPWNASNNVFIFEYELTIYPHTNEEISNLHNKHKER